MNKKTEITKKEFLRALIVGGVLLLIGRFIIVGGMLNAYNEVFLCSKH